VLIFRDRTERRKAEKKLEESYAQIEVINEKLHVLGSLTRHDVGNKLSVIQSSAYLLKKKIGDNPELNKYLDAINSSLELSSQIFEFSRFYERIGVEKQENIEVAESFKQAAAQVQGLRKVKVVNECEGLVVVADSLLKQLFYNLLDNSVKHGEKVTKIRLHYTKDNEAVKLIYEDNGVGVPEENKGRLFDAGFSTGKGSGLGLYLIKKMMKVYGWTITEDGEPGKGAKFVISIPASSFIISKKTLETKNVS
jgi:signal transduction histidine kinase